MNMDNQVIRQGIYLNKYGTIAEVNNNENVSKDFEIFSHSIRIKKIKKHVTNIMLLQWRISEGFLSMGF